MHVKVIHNNALDPELQLQGHLSRNWGFYYPSAAIHFPQVPGCEVSQFNDTQAMMDTSLQYMVKFDLRVCTNNFLIFSTQE